MIHCVVVARGAGRACATYFGDDMGSLRVRPDISGKQHCAADALPFAVGDVNPRGSFVHVVDDVTLDIVLGELDTVLDFTDYLTRKAAFIRSGLLQSAAGEQDLLAHYAIRMNDEGEHDFDAGRGGSPVNLPAGEYQRFAQDPRYLARREANRLSYVWDRLIEKFTSHMIERNERGARRLRVRLST